MSEETSNVSSAASVDEKPCSSSSCAAASDRADVTEDAKKLIGAGKKHLVMGDVVSAVGVFQEACSMLAERYGDTADECGEALFLCGKSLLELASMENSVLGNALEGVPDSEEEPQPNNPNIESPDNLDEQAREDLRKQVYEAMAEKSEEAPTENGVEVKTEHGVDKSPMKPELNGHGSPTQEVKLNEVGQSPVAVNGNAESPPESPEKGEPKQNGGNLEKTEEDGETQPEDGDDDDDDDDDEGEEEDGEKNGEGEEDDVGNLQLAWEMLELAKIIYKRKETKDDQLMAAQAYLILGQVSIESANYTQALEDFQECLTLQQTHLPPHSRLLAETHYHLASTLCYIGQYNQAIEHFVSSVKVIEARLGMLQEAVDAAPGASENDVKEMEELKQLLPDIKAQIEDAKESQRTSLAASQAIKQALGGASTSSSFSENGGPSSAFTAVSQIPVKTAAGSSQVSNISHLVRKKRKTEEESPVVDADAKLSKPGVNGCEDTSARNGVEQKSQEPATQSSSA